MKIEARCKTTAMGIMPHTTIEKALKLALSLDIPLWPQLPNVSFYEDMYVQTSQHFPGISVDSIAKKVSFNTLRFEEELNGYFEAMEEPETFALTTEYSAAYHRFLQKDLRGYPAIPGSIKSKPPMSVGSTISNVWGFAIRSQVDLSPAPGL